MSVTAAASSTRDGGDGAHAAARVTVRIRSAMPGRFRIWVPGLYHNEEMKRAIEAAFQGPSARHASVNLVSGTLLVRALRDASAESLLDELQSIERFSEQHAVSLHELERRGRLRPIHFARRAQARSRRSAFAA